MYTANDATLQTDNTLLNNSAVAKSGVSWGAIFAGATAAASLSLILLILGTGLGLSSVSPWSQDGISATTFGISTIVWITFMSLAASAIGGYIAGRLRTKWVGVHTDEVFFRDTAHGFLAWGVATLVTAMFLTSVIGAIIGGGVKAGASVVGGVASTAGMATQAAASGMDKDNKEQLNYFVDSLFRQGSDQSEETTTPQASGNSEPEIDGTAAETAGTATNNDNNESLSPDDSSSSNQMTSTAEATAEVTRIFANALWRNEDLPNEDVRYVGQLIADRTDLTQEEAEERVTQVFSRVQQQLEEIATTAKEAADTARKTSAYASLWFFVSLLAGAFVASFAATIGGRQRDL